MAFYVYILASQRNGTLYTGSTDSIVTRTSQHRQSLGQGFTAKYGVHLLVWFEAHDTRGGAFRREHQIKKWNRVWKLELIERFNLEWRDLFDDLFQPPCELERTGSPLSRGCPEFNNGDMV
jgi:putative endonuclease